MNLEKQISWNGREKRGEIRERRGGKRMERIGEGKEREKQRKEISLDATGSVHGTISLLSKINNDRWRFEHLSCLYAVNYITVCTKLTDEEKFFSTKTSS